MKNVFLLSTTLFLTACANAPMAEAEAAPAPEAAVPETAAPAPAVPVTQGLTQEQRFEVWKGQFINRVKASQRMR